MSKHEHDYGPGNPFKGVTYFKNPVTSRLALYFAFELEPNREYLYQITVDGVNFEEIRRRSTKGLTHTIYESWNIPDPGNGVWPRLIDTGPSA